MEKPGFYAILPAYVRYDKRLKAAEKILYAEITALSNVEGYCYASNSYFADLFEVSKSTVKGWIANLKELGYVDVELDTDEAGRILKRKITPAVELPQPPGQKSDPPPAENLTHPRSEIWPHNNTRDNNTRLSSSKEKTELQDAEQTTTMTALTQKAENAFGTLTAYQREQLQEAVAALGEPLAAEILATSLTNGARKYVYLQKALDKARKQRITTVDQYRGNHQKETGAVVDREKPSGNDILRRAIGRPMRLKREE